MRDFDYSVPETAAEACDLLAQHGEKARVIAGGTALLLALRQRMVAPRQIVSLARIRELRGIHFDPDEGLRIGAMSLHSEVAASKAVREHYPMLADMASRLANPQVRNQGTIGGNICYADPATDPPTCLMALDARIVIAGREGHREIAIGDFLIDYYTTSLAADEILVAIKVPPPRFTHGRHVRFHRTAAEHRPLVNLSLTWRQDDGSRRDVRLVVGASTILPTRSPAAEALLEGRQLDVATAREAAALVAAGIEPISDIRGDAEYRRAMVRVVASRAIMQLADIEHQEETAA
jgi:carbon-monoxide dehydrogenase medium subunit